MRAFFRRSHRRELPDNLWEIPVPAQALASATSDRFASERAEPAQPPARPLESQPRRLESLHAFKRGNDARGAGFQAQLDRWNLDLTPLSEAIAKLDDSSDTAARAAAYRGAREIELTAFSSDNAMRPAYRPSANAATRRGRNRVGATAVMMACYMSIVFAVFVFSSGAMLAAINVAQGGSFVPEITSSAAPLEPLRQMQLEYQQRSTLR